MDFFLATTSRIIGIDFYLMRQLNREMVTRKSRQHEPIRNLQRVANHFVRHVKGWCHGFWKELGRKARKRSSKKAKSVMKDVDVGPEGHQGTAGKGCVWHRCSSAGTCEGEM